MLKWRRLKYERNAAADNSRNGYNDKKLKTSLGLASKNMLKK